MRPGQFRLLRRVGHRDDPGAGLRGPPGRPGCPTPPMPSTTAVSPSRSPTAAWRAPRSSRRRSAPRRWRSRRDSGTGTRLRSGTTTYSASPPSMLKPSWPGLVVADVGPPGQALLAPAAEQLVVDRDPVAGLTASRPAPVAATTPAASWPSVIGYGSGLIMPSRMCRSVPHTPAAWMRTRTSSGSGLGVGWLVQAQAQVGEDSGSTHDGAGSFSGATLCGDAVGHIPELHFVIGWRCRRRPPGGSGWPRSSGGRGQPVQQAGRLVDEHRA